VLRSAEECAPPPAPPLRTCNTHSQPKSKHATAVPRKSSPRVVKQQSSCRELFVSTATERDVLAGENLHMVLRDAGQELEALASLICPFW
jgi:hypothetical protein